VKPFIKWAGGKRGLVDLIKPLLPESIGGYSECFVGGGAVFWGLFSKARPARLSDINPRLVATYTAIRDDHAEVIRILQGMANTREEYERIRVLFNTQRDAPIAERAAWFIYLNKTCTNGLYRENLAGEFNASYGDGKGAICDAENIASCAAILAGVQIDVLDFEAALARVQPGEFVYLDPPYIPLTNDANFTSYAKGGFSWPVLDKSTQMGLFKPKKSDHERLADCLRDLDARGVRFVLSNSDTPIGRALYAGFEIETIMVRRSIGLGAERREDAPELLVHNKRKT
jgi:DNA adenine methylase